MIPCKPEKVRPANKNRGVADYVELDISVVTVEDGRPANLDRVTG